MFASLAATIRRFPWWGQALAWPFYGVARAVSGILGWAACEMGGQATKGAKKIFAPFVWPAAGLLGLGLLYATSSPEEFQALLGTLLQFAIALVGLRIILLFVWPWGGKKKKAKK